MKVLVFGEFSARIRDEFEKRGHDAWSRDLLPSERNGKHIKPTNIVEGRNGRVWKEAPHPDRWKNRSRTLPGIAEAMAEQWSRFK